MGVGGIAQITACRAFKPGCRAFKPGWNAQGWVQALLRVLHSPGGVGSSGLGCFSYCSETLDECLISAPALNGSGLLQQFAPLPGGRGWLFWHRGNISVRKSKIRSRVNAEH